MSKKCNIYITGSTGMIGLALIRSLLLHDRDNQHLHLGRIFAIVREDSRKLDLLPKDDRITIVPCDLDHLNQLPDILDRMGFHSTDRLRRRTNVFYHFGWDGTGGAANRAKTDVQYKNMKYTEYAVLAADKLGCGKFIGAGSQAEYGMCRDLPLRPDSEPHPISPYGSAKELVGSFVLDFCRHRGIDGIWVRIFSVYGTHDRANSMVMSTLQKLKSGEKPLFTPAEQLWDYLNEEDAGNAFRMIGDLCTGSRIYCLASGESHPLKDYIDQIRDAVDPALPLGIGDLPYPDHGPRDLAADISSLQKDTGWNPQISFAEGISEILRSQSLKST
ncbi:MAG: NAD(P)-dependent oxidoreductase [Eubacterium sp.]|nr:NAD(P)-dependent oxidoreductase [Eubacterium sp.]